MSNTTTNSDASVQSETPSDKSASNAVMIKPPLSPKWSKNAQVFSAIPVCRTCAVENNIKDGTLMAFPSKFTCGMNKCENSSSYLTIE